MMKFFHSQRPGINPRAIEQRPINRARTERQVRFIGRNFVAGGFIPWRRWHTILLAVAVLLLFNLLGCQTNEQQATENGELVTETAVTQSPTLQSPTATITVTEPVEVEPVETSPANADVTFVRAVSSGENTWTFHVTVDHPDTGWEDYADGWDVVLPDGTIVKPDETSPFTRLLTHPHETERPFTRSQSNIVIPASITSVTVRAHDLVDGFGGKEVVVDLTAVSGTDFEVTR